METGGRSEWKLTPEQYAKVNFRRNQANLPYPEKVRLVVEMQRRLVPIYAARGRVIVPWKLDRNESGFE